MQMDKAQGHVVALDELLGLKPGWDGARAARPDHDAIHQAREVVSWFGSGMPVPSVSPTPGGGVLLRWVVQGREIEVTFRRKGGEYLVATLGDPNPLEDGEFDQVGDLRGILIKHVGLAS
jgi:hypothetical protein